ncbi:RHS repeat domain-containing protein [Frankia sp. CiP3]|uniref:RHS repeat domain-containing protein n=1 Tax=Frankia sp. CiP3 TaxID=2880971 RepID=UPI001EF41F92|nr:RHS repeat-associated core domain-containing protein [Frankia sp. CiP3]
MEGQAPTAQVKVTFQYRLGTNAATAWTNIPTGDVTVLGTATHPSWPMVRNGSGLFDKLTWDVTATVTAAGGADGPVQIQPCFLDASNVTLCAPLHTLQFLRSAFADAAATQPVGPGTWAPLTGDFAVSATDASMPTYTGSLSAGRTATSLAPAGVSSLPAGVFGPGWTASLPGPAAGSAAETLTDNTDASGYATLTGADGVQSLYTRSGSGGYPYSYTGVGDAGTDGSVLVKDSATQFTFTDDDGSKTVYTAKTVGASTVWVVSQVVEPGSSTTSTFTTDSAGRVTRILAPVPAGVSCTTLVAGCRALDVTYAASTTATGTDPGTWGDSAGRVSALAMNLNGATPVTVARYLYDSTGHLRAEWDPRLDNTDGSHLQTVYSYTAQGRLATITPPGQAAWTLAYDGTGRLATVSRPDPSGPTAMQTVVYDVPVSGSGAPIDLSPTAVAGWAQQDLPLYGAGVFPAGHIPASPPTSADWPYADLTYLNSDGRAVNSASYGVGAWQVSTTEHDARGNVIRTLSAGNRAQALAPTADTDPTVTALTASAARAQQLDDQSVYAADGVEVVDSYGPTHQVLLDDGSTVSARAHVHTDYDQGAPTASTPFRLATTVTASARVGGISTGTDRDSRVTVNGYEAKAGADPNTSGWVQRRPTTVTVQMGSGNPTVVRTSYYNTAGQVVESRMPKANSTGTDAFTTVIAYYTATGSGGCVNAAWTGLACSSGPAAQPSSGNPLPTVKYTYNDLGQVLTAVETVNTTTRTATTGYDAAGRKTSAAIAASPAADGGATLPTVTYAYSTTTGLPISTGDGTTTLTIGYDSLGRVTSQTDADGNTATTGYDIDGQVTSRADGKGTATYTYDSASEHRGLVTALNVGAGSAPSTFTGSYDADGKLTSQTYPNGVVASTRYDNDGNPTALTYAKSGTTWLAFTQKRSVFDQARADAGPANSTGYTYDLAGRLVQVADTRAYGGPVICSTRQYGYDAESNRTSLVNHPDAGGNPTSGNCSSTTTADFTLNSTYDQADRLTNTGYGYDLFGRTTGLTVAGGAAASVGYYVNDMVASQAQGSTSRSYALDPARRIRSWTQASTTSTNHYADGGDSPVWIGVSDGTWTRNISGIGGDLAAIQSNTGTVTVQLVNLHGDVVATADDSTAVSSIASFADSTEFGLPVFASTAYPRYGWLGGKERSADALGGLVLMGVRLYNPLTGRFLQVDPLPGGNANPYDYCSGDPINCTDLDGQWGFHWRSVLTFTAVAAGVIGAVACGATVVCGVAVGIAAGAAAYAAENAGTRNWSWTGFGAAAAVGGLLSVPVAPEATAGRAIYHSGAARFARPARATTYATGGRFYPSRRVAIAAAKRFERRYRARGCAVYRGPCAAGNHVHVDVYNGAGKLRYTMHYRWH